jgi:DDE superfamily endonuclease
MLIAFSTPPFYTAVVKLPGLPTSIPPEITGNPKFFPFFSDAIGALDGTQINRSPSRPERENWQNCKGGLTQNCLAACSFNLLFTYFLSRWEGSTADATLFNDAQQMDFEIPLGKYYIADASFPSCDKLLIPYQGVRYHLSEWQGSQLRYIPQ